MRRATERRVARSTRNTAPSTGRRACCSTGRYSAVPAAGSDWRTKMAAGPGQTLKTLVQTRRGVLMPGAANALPARIIEELGYEAVHVTGAGVSNTWLGLPDLGFLGLGEIADPTAAIRDAVSLPLVVAAVDRTSNLM